MAVVQSWLHTDRRSVPQHAWQIFDERHTMVYRKSHSRMVRGVSERDEGEAQSIPLHHPNIQVEIFDWQVVHWLVPSGEAQGIMRVQSSFVVVWINSMIKSEISSKIYLQIFFFENLLQQQH